MSFRNDGSQACEWKRWLARHRAALIRAGIPDLILRDERHWIVFLESGGWDAESGFDVDLLSLDQARELHGFLSTEYGTDLSGGCIQKLERRFSKCAIFIAPSISMSPGRRIKA